MTDTFYRFDCGFSDSLLDNIPFVKNGEKSKFLILPYGTYSYVANTANDAYSFVDENKTLVFLIPTYNYCSQNLMTFYENNLLNYDIDYELLNEILLSFELDREEFKFEEQEIFKLHYDLVKGKFSKIKILPLFFYNLQSGIIVDILNKYSEKCTFVLLSNLSSGLNYRDAQKFDVYTASCIEQSVEKDYSVESFTAFKVLPEILKFFRQRRFYFIRLALLNSADYNKNLASTKGFGAWFLYEGTPRRYLKTYYSDLILDFVKFNLQKNLRVACTEKCFNLPAVFNQEFKVFVSLEKNDFVRGVNGSFKELVPFYMALTKRTFGCAFSDERFAPLKPEELDKINLTVTLMGDEVLRSAVIEG